MEQMRTIRTQMIGVHINYFLLKARTNYVLVTEPVIGVAHIAGPATLDPTRGCTVPAARTEKQTRNYFLHPMVIFFLCQIAANTNW